ncbi:MAG TPA: NAD(P)-dependent oxidoreductase [Puia sp.]|nr:NAD(P)-dependent oxidoreductase [Puia sp.]
MIAFLGTGLLGSNFTQALIKKGEKVNVWNRTAARAKALEIIGAKAFESPADAVKGADRIHLTLKDDDSVNEVLEKAKPGLKHGAIIIDHTTTSFEGAAERTARWKSLGFTYLHAPVFMGPQNALESTGYMLVSGDEAVIKSVEPELKKMTGKLIHFGPGVNTAAGMKLIGNLFLISLTGGLADALALAKTLGIPSQNLLDLFDLWNPASMVNGRLKRMISDDFRQPSWELSMARKDARLMVEEMKKQGKTLTVIPPVAALMDEWIKAGHGSEDWMIISRGEPKKK